MRAQDEATFVVPSTIFLFLSALAQASVSKDAQR